MNPKFWRSNQFENHIEFRRHTCFPNITTSPHKEIFERKTCKKFNFRDI